MLLLAAIACAGPASASAAPTFDPACVPWQRVEFRAQKFFMTVHMDLEARTLSTLPPDALREVENLPAIAPGNRTLELALHTRGPGRRESQATLLLNPESGALLQSASLRGEPSPRYRIYRFTAAGPLRWSLRPQPEQPHASPSDWTGSEAQLYPYVGGPATEPVVDVSSLLYLLPASGIKLPGDRLQLLGFASSSEQLFKVTATAAAPTRTTVNYLESHGGAAVSRSETRSVLPISIEGAPRIASEEGGAMEILGLRDLVFLLDPERRVIVGFHARMPNFGRLTVHLQQVELTAAPAGRCAAGRSSASR